MDTDRTDSVGGEGGLSKAMTAAAADVYNIMISYLTK